MSNPRSVAVKILGREIQVNCPDGQEHELLDAAYYLDQTMQTIRKQGRVIGLERIAIMAGLNMANELLQVRDQREEYIRMTNSSLQRLTDKLQKSLSVHNREESNKDVNLAFSECEEELEV